jgi:hypothetical protein
MKVSFLGSLISVLLALGTSSTSFANSAGCGLGSLIFQKDTILSQTLAETFNGSFLTQFFGITSGTSNCSAHGFAFQEREASIYAESNLPSLKIEMARGQGENLNAFSQLLGCKDSESFAQMTKSKYQSIFPSQDVDANQMLQNVKSEIKNNSTLSQTCLVQG